MQDEDHMNSCQHRNFCDFFLEYRTTKNQSLVVAFRKAMLEKPKELLLLLLLLLLSIYNWPYILFKATDREKDGC